MTTNPTLLQLCEIRHINQSETDSSGVTPRRRIRFIGCLTVTAVIALCESPVSATPLLETTATASNGGDPKSATSGTVSSQKTFSYEGGSSATNSQASFGVLRVFSEAHASYNGSNDIIFSGSSASFREDFTINSPGKAGQAGTMTIKISIHGNLSGNLRVAGSEQFSPQQSTSRAELNLSQFDGGGTISFSNHSVRFNAYNQAAVVTEGQPFLNQVSTFTLPITFGVPFQLRVRLQSSSYARREFGADCVSDLANTGQWDGISEVKDSGGNPLSEYSVVSGTGTDYTGSIRYAPEVKEFAINNSTPKISFSTLVGRFYTVERSSLLTESSWLTLSNATNIPGTGGLMQIEDTEPGAGSGPAFFYRVGLKP